MLERLLLTSLVIAVAGFANANAASGGRKKDRDRLFRADESVDIVASMINDQWSSYRDLQDDQKAIVDGYVEWAYEYLQRNAGSRVDVAIDIFVERLENLIVPKGRNNESKIRKAIERDMRHSLCAAMHSGKCVAATADSAPPMSFLATKSKPGKRPPTKEQKDLINIMRFKMQDAHVMTKAPAFGVMIDDVKALFAKLQQKGIQTVHVIGIEEAVAIDPIVIVVNAAQKACLLIRPEDEDQQRCLLCGGKSSDPMCRACEAEAMMTRRGNTDYVIYPR